MSKITEDYVNSENLKHFLNVWNREIKVDEIFALYRDELNNSYDSPY